MHAAVNIAGPCTPVDLFVGLHAAYLNIGRSTGRRLFHTSLQGVVKDICYLFLFSFHFLNFFFHILIVD